MELPGEVDDFLQSHHVLTLATTSGGAPYACNCYYVFNPADASFVFLSNPETRHGREMAADARVAGTVHVEPPADQVALIQGVQFTGRVQRLAEEANGEREAYYAAVPYAKDVPGGVFWKITCDFIKMTDNTVRFGYKILWEPGGS